ncbi:hypothetical protein CNR22_17390 [Sphingobacteriaceae bacterium]|nr:hypothetical protein CNR22_17390 [Sphingobacteriaceae bacterium]
MTIQKTNVQFRNKNYEVILEDGIVSYIDPLKPDLRRSTNQAGGQKITTMDGAKRAALQSIERTIVPSMRFSD